MLRKDTKEKKAKFMALSGYVDLPDADGVVSDVSPWKKDSKGKYIRKENELVWTPTIKEYFPSAVGHMVKSGKLCLVSELEEFYPDHYEVFIDSLDAKEKAALEKAAKAAKDAKNAK